VFIYKESTVKAAEPSDFIEKFCSVVQIKYTILREAIAVEHAVSVTHSFSI